MKGTQCCVILPRLRCKHRKIYKISQNIISFRGVFTPTGHIYKPLIEKHRGHFDSDLFLLTRWEIFAIIADGDFINLTMYSFTRAKKKCDSYLLVRIRSRPGRAYETA